jgi:hypothetical protein
VNLEPINKDFITPADFANALGISEGLAKRLLDTSVALWTNKRFYVYRCPDCGKVLKKSTSLTDMVGSKVVCTGPHEDDLIHIISHSGLSIEYGR